MAFDYGKVLDTLKGSEGSTEEKSYKYRLVYPSEGTLNVRLLFNPKSGLITRLINRHNINGTKIPCMATYTKKDDCPICKVLSQAESAGIKVPLQAKSKVRAIMFAQYHSSSYEITDLNKGDIILLMVPWSVYKDIQKFINDVSSTNESLDAAFNSPAYFAFTIEKGASNQDWSGRINPVITVDSGCKTHEEFEQMMENIDSLYDAIGNIHETPTDNDIKIMTDAADQLRNALYNAPETPVAPTNPNQTPASASGALSSHTPQTEFNTNLDAPECYGVNYTPETDTNPVKAVQRIKCKLCGFKDKCIELSSIPF